MARTESQMLELGTTAPAFSLPDPDGNLHSLADGRAAYLVIFICNHCPFVKHVREELSRIGHDYLQRGVQILAVNSNDTSAHPEDGPEYMKQEAIDWGYQFPYLFDESQEVARAYRAACTPDFFLFDADKKLVYRGQLDDSRPSNDIPVTGKDLRAALDAILSGSPVSPEQKPSIGCNIKWIAGSEPDYYA